ncbi:MAG: hypothetical protein ACRDTE_25050 [Pseudonocardiaceae bacterium]
MGERFAAMFESFSPQSEIRAAPESDTSVVAPTRESDGSRGELEGVVENDTPWLSRWSLFQSGETRIENALRGAIVEYVEDAVLERLEGLELGSLIGSEVEAKDVDAMLTALETLVQELASEIEELIVALLAELGRNK